MPGSLSDLFPHFMTKIQTRIHNTGKGGIQIPPPHLEPIHLTPKSLILLKKTKNEIRMGGGGGSDN